MKILISNIKLLLTLSILQLALLPAWTNTPKYSNEFLAVGVGARSLAMGNSAVSIVGDVSSGYWNPAGLSSMSSNMELMLMHTQHFGGIARHDYGALGFNLDEVSGLAISFIRMGVDDIPDTSELIDSDGNINYDRIRSFNAADNALIVSYGRAASEALSVGANAKIIRRTAGSFAGAWGFGLDAGVQYHGSNWSVGLMARDITTTYNAWTYQLDDRMREVFTLTGNEIPENSIEITLPSFVAGGAYNINITEKIGVLAALDIKFATDGKRNVLVNAGPISMDPGIGIEIHYADMIFLRTGVNDYQEYTRLDESFSGSAKWTMGLGVSIREALSIEYALTDVGDNSIALYSNVFSVRLNINRRTQ